MKKYGFPVFLCLHFLMEKVPVCSLCIMGGFASAVWQQHLQQHHVWERGMVLSSKFVLQKFENFYVT